MKAGLLAGLLVLAARAAPPTAEAWLPRATMVSRDQSVTITAAPATLGYRGAVLIFVDRFRRDFLRVTQLELGRVASPMLIHLGDATNDLRVLARHGAMVTGGAQTWLELPDPEHANLDELRTALALALVRQWRQAQGAAGAACEPPEWLLAGVARHADASQRMLDFDQVQMQWLRGRIPPLPELLADPPPAALQQRALQAVMAAWLLERPGGEPLGALLRRMDGGTPWPAVLYPATNNAAKGLSDLAAEWDVWQVRVMREIRQAGVTMPGLVRAFRAQLLVYPGDHGLTMPEGWRGRTLRECLQWPITPAVQGALRSQGTAIRLFTVGRDGALQQVAADYAAFCEALAGGRAPLTVQALLTKAEEGRRRLEARAQSGAIWQEPVPETLPVVPWR